MKPSFLLSAVAAVTLVAASPLSAITVATDPVGFANLNLPANSDSHITVPFTRPADFVGAIQSVSGNTITVAGSPNFAANKYVYAAGSQPNHYYALLGTGGSSNPKEGHTFLITANGTNTLTVDTSVEPLTGVTQNTQVSIIPYWTLATVFPASDANVSFTATTATSQLKTELRIPNDQATGTNLPPLAAYYFSNNANGSSNNIGWRLVGDNTTDRGDDILLPDSFFIVRNQNGAPTLPLTTLGAVLTKKFSTPLRTITTGPQDNPAAVVRPLDVTLNTLGLTPTDGTFVPGANKDQLLVYNNAQIGFDKQPAKTYYRDALQNFTWRELNDGSTLDHGNDVIPMGTGFIVRKAATAQPSNVFWTNSFPVQAVSAVSRKVHGGAGTFDLNLPVSGTPAIESRAGNYQIVVNFPTAVSFTGAAATYGSATVDSATGSGTNQATINLSNVASQQYVTVTLGSVNDGSNTNDVAVTMGVLVGDASADGTVNSGDLTATRSRSGQTADATNFRLDYNFDGSINSSDATIVRGRSGNALP